MFTLQSWSPQGLEELQKPEKGFLGSLVFDLILSFLQNLENFRSWIMTLSSVFELVAAIVFLFFFITASLKY